MTSTFSADESHLPEGDADLSILGGDSDRGVDHFPAEN